MSAYTVEVDNQGCPHCYHEMTWVVIDPDGYAGGRSYGSKEDAEDIADLMNQAFERGQSAPKGER